MKKRANLSMQVIIVAILLLVVLVVLGVIFGESMKEFFTGVKDCSSKGGSCVLKSSCSTGGVIFGPKCDTAGEVCCLT